MIGKKESKEAVRKERPIIFSAPMVLAVLAGTKTQTRRIVKPQPEYEAWPLADIAISGNDEKAGFAVWWMDENNRHDGATFCPFGQPGDRLWVRETWATHFIYERVRPRNILIDSRSCLFYRADGAITGGCEEGQRAAQWRPAIHMPRKASRITLEITGVRVERLQEISEADVQAEGCTGSPFGTQADAMLFPALWDRIHGAGAWEENPWVWVLEFKRVGL